MFSTYDPADVTLLLKDITGLVEPQPASVRERLIQSGVHYCEMLPLEYTPSDLYMKTYWRALEQNRTLMARTVAAVAEQIYRQKGPRVALVYFWNIPGYSWMNQTGVQLHAWHALLRGVNP